MREPLIRPADSRDLPVLERYDRHISPEELARSVRDNRVLVLLLDGVWIGWLRYGLFWDNTPFLNMLYILDGYRGAGYGGRLLGDWEAAMARQGHPRVLTSTLSSEQAQNFYRRRGYTDCGALLLPGEPLEILLLKDLP